MFGYCFNYLGVHFFINERQFIVINVQRYCTLLVVYDDVCYEYIIWIDIKPMGFQSFVYRSYHNSTDYMHPSIYFNKTRYSNLAPFPICTLFLCSGFTLHTMSKILPSILNMTNFSFGMPALSYAPGTLKMATSLPLCAPVMRISNRDYKYMVGDDASSLGM